MQIRVSIMKIPIVFFILLSLSAFGAEEKKPNKKATKNTAQEKQKIPKQKGAKQWLMKKNVQISNFVDKTAEKIDHYLTGEKLVKEKNLSRVRLKGFVAHVEGGEFENSTSFDIGLRLPNLEKHWQLKFTNYEEEEERGLRNTQLRRRPVERNYGTSLALFRQLGDVATSFQPRLELKDPLEMSYILRFESQYERGSYWLKPRLEFFADPQKGTGEFASLEMSLKLNPEYTLSFTNDEEYQDFENFFFTNHSVALSQALTENKQISYYVSAALNNKTTYHLDSYSFGTSFGHALYRNMVHYSTGPFWDFSKGRSFKGRVGATFSLELIF